MMMLMMVIWFAAAAAARRPSAHWHCAAAGVGVAAARRRFRCHCCWRRSFRLRRHRRRQDRRWPTWSPPGERARSVHLQSCRAAPVPSGGGGGGGGRWPAISRSKTNSPALILLCASACAVRCRALIELGRRQAQTLSLALTLLFRPALRSVQHQSAGSPAGRACLMRRRFR